MHIGHISLLLLQSKHKSMEVLVDDFEDYYLLVELKKQEKIEQIYDTTFADEMMLLEYLYTIMRELKSPTWSKEVVIIRQFYKTITHTQLYPLSVRITTLSMDEYCRKKREFRNKVLFKNI